MAMSTAELRAAVMALPAATEDFPFGPDTAVYRVGGKMFALISLDEASARINLKCDPDRAINLRELWRAVSPGYHMNKRHWNTVEAGLDLPDEAITELIAHSYALVLASLTRKERERLAAG